ncbi:Ribonuclease T(2) [Handroanthus impetiginosus]|uniref:Ribonuclease T(2) n=1 Tax=Handroanthus impetiginosus TaxID=429701 RepID=A0A2G9I419_9LAMI|nr:Ribonuclease T(2) [Handroanthus impetiginosus]
MVYFYSSLALTFLVFVLQMFANRQRVDCDTPIPLDFTLHGLWPANGAGKSLTCHDPNPGRDHKPLYDSLPDLPVVWPPLNPNIPKEIFWNHEYGKHGVCAKPIVDET